MTQVVDVEACLSAIEQMLADDPVTSSASVEVNERVNEESARMPWVGLYRTGEVFPSRAIGSGAGNRQDRLGLAIIVQETHPLNGRACGVLLEALKRNVLRVLLNDETLKGNVDVLDDIEVVYQHYGLTDTGAYTQQAIIQFTGVTRVRG